MNIHLCNISIIIKPCHANCQGKISTHQAVLVPWRPTALSSLKGQRRRCAKLRHQASENHGDIREDITWIQCFIMFFALEMGMIHLYHLQSSMYFSNVQKKNSMYFSNFQTKTHHVESCAYEHCGSIGIQWNIRCHHLAIKHGNGKWSIYGRLGYLSEIVISHCHV